MTLTYIIAEAGVNHNGKVELARELIDATKARAGADAVKFQTFKTEKILTRTASMAEYQKKNVGTGDTRFEIVKALELSYADFASLQDYAKSIGIDFLSTPDDEDSLDFLVDELDLPWVKIGSGEVNSCPFEENRGKQKPMILSTGMSNIGEVEGDPAAIRALNDKELVLLHCDDYPCPPEEVNLRAMLTPDEHSMSKSDIPITHSKQRNTCRGGCIGAEFIRKSTSRSTRQWKAQTIRRRSTRPNSQK